MQNQKIIFLIEDNEMDYIAVKRSLKLHQLDEEYQLVRFESAETCIQYFAEQELKFQKALFLVDINLPGISGKQLLTKLKPQLPSSLAKFIMFSSSNNDKDISQSYQAGADAYVVKQPNYNRFSEQLKITIKFWLEAAQYA